MAKDCYWQCLPFDHQYHVDEEMMLAQDTLSLASGNLPLQQKGAGNKTEGDVFSLEKLDDDCAVHEWDAQHVYEQIYSDQVYVDCNPGGKEFPLSTISSYPLACATVEEFLRKVESTDELAFGMGKNKLSEDRAYPLELGHWCPRLVHCLRSLVRTRTYSESVELFLSMVHDSDMEMAFEFPYGSWNFDQPNWKLINRFIEDLRSALVAPKFRKRLKNQQDVYRTRMASLHEYINALFLKYARLMVVRFDLYYASEHARSITFEDAAKDIDNLINNRRHNVIFRDMVGYVVKTEYGEYRGHHFHAVFFYDGSKVHKHEHCADRVGKYWNEVITKGKGWYHNCNRRWAVRSDKLKLCGVGMVDHHDSAKREKLMHALAYLAKKDQYVKVKCSQHAHLFRRGRMPVIDEVHSKHRRGRPRKDMQAQAFCPDAGKVASIGQEAVL